MRLQGQQPTRSLQVAEPARRILNVGFEMINGLLIFGPAPLGQGGKLLRDRRGTLAGKGLETLVERAIEGLIAREQPPVQQAYGELGVIVVLRDALLDGVNGMTGPVSGIPQGLQERRDG